MEEKKSSGLTVAGLVLSIIAVIFSFIPIINFLSYIFVIISLVFGIIGVVKNKSKVMAIVVILLSIYAVFQVRLTTRKLVDFGKEIGKEINKTFSQSIEENLKKVDVKIGEFTSSESEYGIPDTKLPVTVKNKTNTSLSISIEIEAVDGDGSRILTSTGYANTLSSEQSEELNLFTFVESDKLDKVKKAKFKIINLNTYESVQSTNKSISVKESENEENNTAAKNENNTTSYEQQKKVEIKYGEFSATKSKYGTLLTSLPVTVTNKADSAKSITIQVEAVDEAGNRILTSFGTATKLAPGQSEELSLFRYIAEDKAEKLKTARFKALKIHTY